MFREGLYRPCLLALCFAFAGMGLVGFAHGEPGSAAAHQRVVFENAHVRVQELFASPGARSPMHVQAPGVLVSAAKARFEVTADDGSISTVDYHPGQVAWVETPQARSWKLLAGDAHLFFIEVKSLANAEVPPEAPREPTHSTVVDGEQHHLVLDNTHVRVIDGMADAGASSATHTHPPSVLVSLSKARFRVTIDGKTRIFDFEPGMVRWTNHFEHTWRILSGDARVIMVELKSAHGDPAFTRRR